MSQRQKDLERIGLCPKDYTYSEAKRLLGYFGFEEHTKGKTSGSRVIFYRESDKATIMLHKPHPQDEMKPGAVKQLRDELRKLGELE